MQIPSERPFFVIKALGIELNRSEDLMREFLNRIGKRLLGWCIRQDLNLQPSDPKSEALSN
jgi:hypothetical protein